MYLNHPMVENNGELKFIFSNSETMISTDIYSFSSSLSLSELEEETLSVFPNPSVNGDVIIELSAADQILITSLEGKLVQKFKGVKGGNAIHLHESGVYLIHSNGKSQKVIIQ